MRISDWSSDVCSSDLLTQPLDERYGRDIQRNGAEKASADNGDYRGIETEKRHHCDRGQCARQDERFHGRHANRAHRIDFRSEEHTSELQSLMRISYAVFCLNKTKYETNNTQKTQH